MQSIDSKDVGKIIKRLLVPVLLEHGFTKRKGVRTAWKYNSSSIAFVVVSSVGKHFADVTGFPPSSLRVALAVYYPFIPCSIPLQYDRRDGLPLPIVAHQYHDLQVSDFSKQIRRDLPNPAERVRRDVWWMERDGSNVEDMILDVAQAFRNDGMDWFRRVEEPAAAIYEVEGQRDCPRKYELMYFLSKEAGDAAMVAQYEPLYRESRSRM